MSDQQPNTLPPLPRMPRACCLAGVVPGRDPAGSATISMICPALDA